MNLVFFTNHTDVCLISDAAQVVLLGLFIWPCRLSSASWDSAAKDEDFSYGTTDRRMTVLIENISLYITMEQIQRLADMSCFDTSKNRSNSSVSGGIDTLKRFHIMPVWLHAMAQRHRHSLLKIQHFKVSRCNYSNILYWLVTTARYCFHFTHSNPF